MFDNAMLAAGSCLNMVDAIMTDKVINWEVFEEILNLIFRDEMVLQLFVHRVIMHIQVWIMVFVILIMLLFVQDIYKKIIIFNGKNLNLILNKIFLFLF